MDVALHLKLFLSAGLRQNGTSHEGSNRRGAKEEEEFALIEIIAMMKELQVLMARMETVCPCHPSALRLAAGFRSAHSPWTSINLYTRIAIKNKNWFEGKKHFISHWPSKIKLVSFSIVVSTRETCADWMRGTEPHDDPASKGKKDPENGFEIQVSQMNVGLYARISKEIQTFSHWFFHRFWVKTGPRRLGCTRWGPCSNCSWRRKVWRTTTLMAIDQFHKNSFSWNYLLNFNRKRCT